MSDEALKKYHEKRDFSKTPEPKGGVPSERPRFCVQRHEATRLHYDFRLEANGVLLSWAVPEGPSFDPAEKRLAVRTEDHPIDYLEFEGIIPEKQYGAGTVVVWDLGIYQNITTKKDKKLETMEAVEHGHIKFVMLGEKLKGTFALTRMGNANEKNWLLVKVNDEYADPDKNPVRDRPESVLTGRTNDQLNADNSETWHSNR
jgi:DNA ligase D-like protein (predicted 3'-phosphoesterase)